ncbi:alpha 1,2 mannosyltransferase [Linnemannia zychae]|nr:alpha 1,2 mannosyltransferase [Linnemannia zychae]
MPLVQQQLDHFVTSRALFITQRLASVIVSLVIDWSIVQMARQIRRSPSIALLLVSSSYVTLAYHTHPFSNLVETAVLALSAVVLGKIIQRYDASTTTPSPIAAKERVDQNLTKSHPSLVGLATFIRACMPLAVGLSTTSVIALLIDSIYFGKLIVARHSNSLPMSLWEIFTMNPLEWSTLSVHGSLTLAMLNNLQYNLDKENLALHGLHPRYLHLLVNFPVLFGNLAWIGVTTIISKILAGEWTSQSKLVTGNLPKDFKTRSKVLVMNSVLAIVFSIFHQGGLVPAIDLVQKQSLSFQNCVYHAKDENTYSTRVVFYKTYMPPHHLFGYNLPRAHAHGVQLDILDWRNMTKEQLLHDLYSSNGNNDRAVDRQLLRAARNMTRIKQNAVLFRQVGPGHFERTLLITPGTVDFSDQEFDRDDTKDWISHHANLDHLPELLQRPLSGLRLNVYYL